MNLKLATLFLLLVCACGAFGQINSSFYVSTTGNDSNPGTQAAPWRTVQHAADTVRAGSTVNVRGGVYEELVSHQDIRQRDGWIHYFSKLSRRDRNSRRNAFHSLRQTGRTHAFTTRATCESKALKFATSTPPNIDSLHWA